MKRYKRMHEGKANFLIWQWGRRGAGPKIAVELSRALKAVTNSNIYLSLSKQAEIIVSQPGIVVDFPFSTYSSVMGYVIRWLQFPYLVFHLYRQLRKTKIDLAICTMPGLLDPLMVCALKFLKIPYVVIIHDAHPHPGDGYLFQYFLQKKLIQKAKLVVTFSKYVYNQLLLENPGLSSRLINGWHPPFGYSFLQKTGKDRKNNIIHLLNFGRLLPYKGFTLLDAALDHLKTDKSYCFRIVGQGPKSRILSKLDARKQVTVENRWVPENEIASIMEWADAVILPYEEASQSGVLAIALAFGKPVLITNVGGLVEQCHQKDLVFLCEPTSIGVAKGIEQILDLSFPLYRARMNASQEWENFGRYFIRQVCDKLCLSKDIKIS